MKYTLARFPAAFAAYSLRRLTPVTGTTGQVNIIQIIKDSDSTELIVTADALGYLDTESIIDFCTGTTCRVSTWYDQSGGGRDLTPVGTAPIIFESGAIVTGSNGKPAVKFSGNGHLQTGSSYNATKEFTVFTVAQFDVDAINTGEYIIKFPDSSIRKSDQRSVGALFGVTTLHSNLNTASLPIKNFTDAAVICLVNQESPNQAGISFAGTELKTSTNLTASTSASKIIVGSSSEAGANRLNGRVQEILYFQHNKIQDKFEIENELNTIYESSNIFRSELDTVENSYVSPVFTYSLRISKPVLHSLIDHNRTATQLAASGILPLLEVITLSGGLLPRAYVYPDINGTISLNSIVKISLGSFTFTKPIPTLGEFLGNPKYSAAGAAHTDGRVYTWFNQAYDRIISNPLFSTSHLYSDGIYLNCPLIYSASEGVIKTLNSKPAIVFENQNQKLETQAISSTTFLQVSTATTNSADGFLNFVLGSTNAIQEVQQNLLKISHSPGGSLQSLLELSVGDNAADESKVRGIIRQQGGSIVQDLSTNALTPNTQYLMSSARALASFYVTENGVSNVKTTLTATGITPVSPMYVTVGGTYFAGKIQEIVGFNIGGESYKIDIEEEFNRYYNIDTLQSLSQSVVSTYSTGLKAVYSLRRTGNYGANKILKIRRTSDSAERFVFADAEGRISYLSPVSESESIAGTENFESFCRGANCTVSAWYDQSGGEAHVSQATLSYQPKIYDAATGMVTVNRLPAIRFSGSKLTGTSLVLPSANPISTLIVYKTAVNNTDIKNILSLAGNADNFNQRMVSSTVIIEHNTTNRTLTVSNPINPSISATTFHANTTGNNRGGLSVITKNINFTPQTVGSTGTAFADVTGINIGCRVSTDTTNLYQGDIQEIIVWTSWGNVPQLHEHDRVGHKAKIEASNYYKVY